MGIWSPIVAMGREGFREVEKWERGKLSIGQKWDKVSYSEYHGPTRVGL